MNKRTNAQHVWGQTVNLSVCPFIRNFMHVEDLNTENGPIGGWTNRRCEWGQIIEIYILLLLLTIDGTFLCHDKNVCRDKNVSTQFCASIVL